MLRADSEIEDALQFATDGPNEFGGLDPFGRIQKLVSHADDPGITDLLSCSTYAYDAAGQRIQSRLQRPSSAGSHYLYIDADSTYDGLGRLARHSMSGYSHSGPGTVDIRDDIWHMDALGNWDGGSGAGSLAISDAGRHRTGNLDAYGTPWALATADATADEQGTTFAVDATNKITDIFQDAAIGDDLAQPLAGIPIYDDAGNLITDHRFVYQYDAWNRLIQVSQAVPGIGGVVHNGPLVRQYTYDGLGRLV